jgi:MFS family permease
MNNFSALLQKTRAWLADLTVGGAWGRTLAGGQQHNLRWFWFDGLYASASDNIILNFVSLFIIVLGATESQVGLMSSFSSIACALVLLPGAVLAERAVNKKRLPLFLYAGGRLSILLLVFVPILFKGPLLVWVAIVFAVLRDALTYLAYPAWMDVTNEVVPIEGRGRYFGSRNFVMGIAGMAATLLAGKLITVFVGNLGYQIALAAAFVLGMASTFSYARIRGSELKPSSSSLSRFSLRELGKMIKAQPQFIALTATAALWNFSINISGPFFNVQMVNVLKFSAATIGLLSVVSSFTALITQKRIGPVDDRVGSRRLQFISMCLIPLMPLAWIFVQNAWQVAAVNLFNGIFWGTFNLVSFNLLLASIPKDQVPRFSAVYQIVVMLSLALGALAGSAIVSRVGFHGLLIFSIIGRLITVALFALFVHDPRKPTAVIAS